MNKTMRPSGRTYVPRHARLAAELAARITAGDWTPGANLPIAVQLAASYGVSSWTVRRAVDTLVEAGVLRRRQGSGTFVVTKDKQAMRLP
jgi:GntR family transcriptional regulator